MKTLADLRRTGAWLVLFALVVAAASPPAARAQAPAPDARLIDQAFVDDLRTWIQAPVVVLSVAGRNANQSDFDQAKVDALDKQWRAETESQVQPLITGVLSHPLSSYLLRIQARALGLYSEIFVMDAKGLNVGQSAVTSDYWQGDEAKFQKTFPNGGSAVFIDEPEFHEGTATWRVQVNLSIADDTGAAIGVVTVEVNLTELERRRAAGLAS